MEKEKAVILLEMVYIYKITCLWEHEATSALIKRSFCNADSSCLAFQVELDWKIRIQLCNPREGVLEKTLDTLENSCGNTRLTGGWSGVTFWSQLPPEALSFPPEESLLVTYIHHDEKNVQFRPFEPSAGSVIGSGYLCPTWLFQQCNGSSFNNDCW